MDLGYLGIKPTEIVECGTLNYFIDDLKFYCFKIVFLLNLILLNLKLLVLSNKILNL